jgi:transglutaminase-like putative cysteine protease
MNSDMTIYLQPTPALNYTDPSVSAFAAEHTSGTSDPVQRAIRLYYAIRDGIRYNPYNIEMTVDGLKASRTLATGKGWCVPKAILLAAACRAVGIPARLGFADVKNHLSTARMREAMKTDVFFWHGYTALYLNDNWIKATPAFNIELCERFRIRPLEFDGRADSIYHPFDLEGNRHMEYLSYRGEFADVPIDSIYETFHREYVSPTFGAADFDQDTLLETAEKKQP